MDVKQTDSVELCLTVAFSRDELRYLAKRLGHEPNRLDIIEFVSHAVRAQLQPPPTPPWVNDDAKVAVAQRHLCPYCGFPTDSSTCQQQHP